jgi:uncharacterized protein YaaW (UPF0174 family)
MGGVVSATTLIVQKQVSLEMPSEAVKPKVVLVLTESIDPDGGPASWLMVGLQLSIKSTAGSG